LVLEGILLAVRALIVTHNSAEVIESCLEALAKMAPDVEPLVIDNASTNGSPEAATIANSTNVGFAAAVNQGFRASTESLVLLLNPDARLTTPLEPLIDACAENGLAAGLLTDESGRPQRGFSIRRLPTPAALAFELLGVNRLWPSNPVNRRYRYLDRDLLTAGAVEQPAGAFLMIRRDVWEQLHGFDEQFHPIWFEDVDFCRRALELGYTIEFVPQVRVVHQGGHSVNNLAASRRALLWYGSLLRYAAKAFHRTGYRMVCAAAICSVVPRMFAGILSERSLVPITTFGEILLMAGRRLVSTPTPAQRVG
jgi:GT2 family glycosyltransferase